MTAKRALAGLSALALVFVGCGDDAADDAAPATDSTADDTDPSSCSEAPEEWRDALDDAAPPAPAPGGLAVGMLPTDTDAAIALFDALPAELIGGTKEVPEGLPPGFVEVNYPTPDRRSRDGYQAHDLRDDMLGSILPEPRADLLVGFFVVSDDDDFTVEAAGHDGDLYWVTYIGTNRTAVPATGNGEGTDSVEEVYTITWGEACSPLAFIAQAPTESSRDELIAAFIDAAADLGLGTS